MENEKILCEHIVNVDKYTKVILSIPKELNGMELKALFTKANKLFNISDIEIIPQTESMGLTEDIPSKVTRSKTGGYQPNRRCWTNNELDFVRANYKKIPTKEIAEKLGIKESIVSAKAYYLFNYKYKKSNRDNNSNDLKRSINHFWTNDEIKYIKTFYPKISPREIGKNLNLTANQVSQKIKYLKNKGEL